jgi:5-methylcytosine-specific restriction protein A
LTPLAAKDLRRAVQARFGIAFTVERQMTGEGPIYRIRPSDLPPTIGFIVDVEIGWRSLQARFTPGSFAADLVRAMENSAAQQRVAFRVFAGAAKKAGGILDFRVSGASVDPVSEAWPSDWSSCDLSMRRINLLWGENARDDDEQLRAWTCRFVGLVVALLPVEPVESPPVGEVEGAVVEVLSKRYERSRINRAACIEIQGSRCIVCGFDFEAVYGAIGEGFIHVHHVVSVATVGPGTVIDPGKDLVPVCPNCHAMLHTSRPPLLPSGLRAILDGHRKSG